MVTGKFVSKMLADSYDSASMFPTYSGRFVTTTARTSGYQREGTFFYNHSLFLDPLTIV